MEELAGLRDPEASAAAAVAGAGTSPEGQRAVADEATEPDVVGAGNVQVVALNAHSPAPEELAANTVATGGHAGLTEDQAGAAILTPDPVTPPPSADAPGPGRRPRRRERRGPTLREQRRQRTREAIVDAAAELFIERGCDHVSVMEIAQRAGVVEKTVFNHFPV